MVTGSRLMLLRFCEKNHTGRPVIKKNEITVKTDSQIYKYLCKS